MRGIALAIATLVLAGCGNQSGNAPNLAGSDGIMNGTELTSADQYSQHTVFLQMRLAQGIASCTGSILDSETILTAGHCLTGAKEARVIFAINAKEGLTKDQVRSVDIAAVYPKFQPTPEKTQSQPSVGGAPVAPTPPTLEEVEKDLAESSYVDYDVAMVHFKGGLPAGYSAVKLATSAAVVQPGAELHMIGYGLSKVDPTTKDSPDGPVVVPMPDTTTVGHLRETQVPIAQYNTNAGVILTDGKDTSVCNGDSGGPAFVNDSSGQVLQVGIAEAVTSPYCNSASIHTAIFPYLGWIQQTAASMAKQSNDAAGVTMVSFVQ
jgi:secreted trypsin-like serine protease